MGKSVNIQMQIMVHKILYYAKNVLYVGKIFTKSFFFINPMNIKIIQSRYNKQSQSHKYFQNQFKTPAPGGGIRRLYLGIELNIEIM